jgi:aminoglycoside phosphotransferase (APT) family kinase protein
MLLRNRDMTGIVCARRPGRIIGMEITEPLVRSLLEAQHPDLAHLSLRQAVRGWDNALWRLGEDLAVRIPMTERAPALLLKEARWLPGLAARLPLPVPEPVRVGEPSALLERPWTVARWVPGTPVDLGGIARGPHAARVLAGFLTALHRPAPHDAPTSTRRGVPLTAVTADFDVFSTALLESDLADAAFAVWRAALAADPYRGERVWLHGDLHPANAVAADGTLAGVLDFGELCAGDPAVDIAAAWLVLPDGAAADFFAAYGAVDAPMLARARGWVVYYGASLMNIGLAGDRGQTGGKPSWGPAGRGALTRMLAGR